MTTLELQSPAAGDRHDGKGGTLGVSRSGRRLLALVLVGFAAGCGTMGDDTAAPGWHGETSTEDGVTTVLNEGQVWAAAELVEEVSVGTLEGEDPFVFSDAIRVAGDDDHIYALDQRAGRVRIYDRDGNHLRSIGTPGEGPGEFSRPWDLAPASGGRLLVRDLAQARMHEFAVQSGELLTDWRVSGGGITVFTEAGPAWIYTLQSRNNDGTFDFAMIETDADGRGRSVPLPRSSDPPFVTGSRQGLEVAAMVARQRGLTFSVHTVPFAPQLTWALAPDGTLTWGDATTYTIAMRELDGKETHVVRRIDPVPVDPDEATWYRRRMTDFWREVVPDFTWGGPDIPAHKRAYVSLHPDPTGRLWVLRELAGERLTDCDPDPDDIAGYGLRPCWRQPYALDGFGDDGRFLGGVELPAEVRVDIPLHIRDDSIVAVTQSADGSVMVKRYRLVITEETS